jgi:hypothetical protein
VSNRFAAALCLVTVLGSLPASARQDVAAAPRAREPLAFSIGAAERPDTVRTREARERASAAPDPLLKLPPDDLIEALIDSTKVANVTATVQRLEDFVTRYVVTDSCRAAGSWIRDRFLEYGYADVRLDTFRTWTWQDSVDAVNVLAYKEGALRPSEYVVVGGHYDSITIDNFWDPDAPAPGAEDNASGVAGVLEAARILAGIETERSIVFACWSGEEEGLWGSRAFVRDAVAESLNIVLYLNMDCIGYHAPPLPDAIVFADSTALAVASWMCDIAREFTGYVFEPRVRPLGASDQNSFWEVGYNVLDTATDLSSPYMHTSEDLLVNLDPVYATALAAVNVAATAAVAGVVGQDANLPPETTLVANCAATHTILTARPTFEWEGVDFDGEIAEYELSVLEVGSGPRPPTERERPAAAGPRLRGRRTSITLGPLDPGDYVFQVSAIDDDGLADASPASHAFTVSETLAPTITVETNFLPAPAVFPGAPGARDGPRARVFENELLVFRAVADASAYCGTVESIAVAVGDSADWSIADASSYEFTLRPAPEDTVVFFRIHDENGSGTEGSIELAPVPAPMDLPLLHVDDWMDPSSAPEDPHDDSYSLLLAGHDPGEWDPYEHFEGGCPSLPPMEELGRYDTVLWTLDRYGGLLRPAQAESAYHAIEGYVRAGGNLVLEGQSSLTNLAGGNPFDYGMTFARGEFIFDSVGVDSLWNAWNWSDPGNPGWYGYAFLGGIAVPPFTIIDLPVDTLGVWAENYQTFGGVPWCEIVRPTESAFPLYLFDSYLNPNLDGRPCATVRFPQDGTGTVAWFGFPFYYMEPGPLAEFVDALLDDIVEWQAPAALVLFDWDASPDSVALSWVLDPSDGPLGCNIERANGPGGAFSRLNDTLIAPSTDEAYRFTDATVEPGAAYAYRLEVVERWGGVSDHGPWEVTVPTQPRSNRLELPRPNPCAGVLTIDYTVGADRGTVAIGVYDVAGRLVTTLRRGPAPAGDDSVTWDGRNASGDDVAAGVYFIRATIGAARLERKVVMLR